MAYAIEQGETISASIPRILLERIDTAEQQLLDTKDPVEERIHNARKRFKESRATARLVRFALGEQFSQENAWFRDAGRELASLRDADAVIEAAETLADFTDSFHDRRILRRLIRRLRNRRTHQSQLDHYIDKTVSQLPIARARLTLWPPLSDSFETIGAGFRRTFRDGRRAYNKALAEPTPEHFHDWRKRVKDHWYHVQILRNLWPAFTKPYRDQMEELSDALGDRHDLDVLRESITPDFGTPFDVGVAHSLIDRAAQPLTDKAVAVGAHVYMPEPDVLANRFESYWTLWTQNQALAVRP